MDSFRTCVGCRIRAVRSELLRVVAQDGRLVADHRAVLPGRGAWVHRDLACLRRAVKRKLFLRALKVSGSLDASPFREQARNTHGQLVSGSK